MPAHLKVPPRQPSAAAKEKPWRLRLFGIAAALLAVAIALAVLVVALFIQQLVMADSPLVARSDRRPSTTLGLAFVTPESEACPWGYTGARRRAV